MRRFNLEARTLLLLGAVACGDSGSSDADSNNGENTGSQEGGVTGSQNGDANDGSSGQSAGADEGGATTGGTTQGGNAGSDEVSGTYMPGTADAITPTRGFVFIDPKDQNQNQQAYKIVLTAEPAVGCKIKELDTRLGKISPSDDNVGPNEYLLCRMRAEDMSGKHPASLLGIGFAGFSAIGPGQLECMPTFQMMGKSVGDRVVGSMKWVDAERNYAEVGSFEFDLQFCGEVDTLSM